MSNIKTFKKMKCRTCNEPVDKVDQKAVSVLCWRCTIQLARGTKCEDGVDVFSREADSTGPNSTN